MTGEQRGLQSTAARHGADCVRAGRSGVLMAVRGLPIPRDPRVLAASAAVGLFNTALPFTLITWGETQIPSGLAAILNGTVPLFTLVIAHFMLHDEPMTGARFVGLIVGFLGVVVLVGRDAGGGLGSVWGQAAVVGAAICYASSAAFSRRYLRGQSPITQSFTTLSFAVGFMALGVWLFERPVVFPTHPVVWGAAVWLGLHRIVPGLSAATSAPDQHAGARRGRHWSCVYVSQSSDWFFGITVLGEPTGACSRGPRGGRRHRGRQRPGDRDRTGPALDSTGDAVGNAAVDRRGAARHRSGVSAIGRTSCTSRRSTMTIRRRRVRVRSRC